MLVPCHLPNTACSLCHIASLMVWHGAVLLIWRCVYVLEFNPRVPGCTGGLLQGPEFQGFSFTAHGNCGSVKRIVVIQTLCTH